MDNSSPTQRKLIDDMPFYDLGTYTVNSRKKSKSKKKRLSSDLLSKKLKMKAERAYHKDMKKEYPIGEASSPANKYARRMNQLSRAVDARRATEAFQKAKKAARKARKTSKK